MMWRPCGGPQLSRLQGPVTSHSRKVSEGLHVGVQRQASSRESRRKGRRE
jgi:hypothetical protein